MWGARELYQINNFKEMNRLEKIAITKHAKERQEEHGIKVNDVTHCIHTGEIIKQYEDDKYVMYGMWCESGERIHNRCDGVGKLSGNCQKCPLL